MTTLPSMSAYGAVGQDMAQVSSPFCHEFTTVLCCEPLLGRFLSSPMVVLLTIEGKSCSLFGAFTRRQPQRNMRQLHRLLHHSQQLLTQLAQVHLVA